MELDIGILFIDELLVISDSRKLHFSNSDLFVDGRRRRIEQANSGLTEL